MSKVSIEKVISVSSEHPDHLASNIFSDSSGYWTCNSKGEKQASVVVQLQRSTKVTSVHVGNYGSGFVEVLVGKATSLKEEDFKVLLLCSSLMTLQDSRNEKNMQGVKMFSVAKLNAETRDQYWDRVKVVCTQPFNNHLYGLTFFKLMGESHEVQTSSYSSANALASLTVPSTSSELAPDTIKIGSFFKNRQSLTNSIALNSSTKPTISKQNSKEDISKNTPTKTSVSIASEMRVNSPSTLVAKDSKIEDNSKESPLTGSKPPRKMPNWEMKTPSSASKTTKHKLTRENSQESTEKKLTPVKKERKLSVESASKKPAAPAVKYDKFECLMKDVVFCLSGFVNPLRGELRQKALAMGAKYKQDWDNATSTHLMFVI